jgi:hypothetical protein
MDAAATQDQALQDWQRRNLAYLTEVCGPGVPQAADSTLDAA